ncbi:MAG TPA: hypothetical protein VKB67_10825 [Rhizomicrobium sp.]|nr:hypothetical protein [Rhizomicrobium sp.]
MLQAALLIILIVSVVVGAVSGLVLGGVLGGLPLAVAASLLSLAAAWMAHKAFVNRVSKVGAIRRGVPMLVVVFSIIASLIGSSSATEMTRDLALRPGMTGAIAGLLSAVMMVMLTMCYGWRPGETENQR